MKKNPSPNLCGLKTIFLLFVFFIGVGIQIVYAQDRQITGTVTSSEDGRTLPGTTVLLKGTNKGTVTDLDGNFSITVPEGATLVFSFVGMSTQEVPIGTSNVIDVILEPDYARLDEVVMVGYGTMKKSDLTGAVASIDVEEIETQPITSMEQAMSGKLAGVEVIQASHAPGGGISVRIRGGNSINSNAEPLYVIDGMPIYSDNNMIPSSGPTDGVIPQLNLLAGLNPADIKSIEVLKDASATAIYGARGANGVVLITTKRGTSGKPLIEYGTYFGIQNIANKFEMLDAYQFATLKDEAHTNKGEPIQFTGTMVGDQYFGTPAEYQNGTLPSTDWLDEVLRTGMIINHQLSVSGGNENTRYAISANYLDNEGILVGGGFNRTSLRTNLDSKVNDWLDIGNSLSFSFNKVSNAGSEGGMQWLNGGTVSGAIKAWPVFVPYDATGEYNVTGTGVLRGNPVAYANEAKNELVNNRLVEHLFAVITIMDGLTFKVSGGVDLITNERSRYFPTSVYMGSLSNGSANKTYQKSINILNENVLNYNKSFGVHSINAVAGFTMQKEVNEGHSVSAEDFPSDVYQDNNIGAGAIQDIPGWSFKTQWSMASWLGRINYNLMDKYLFTLTGRADGSSKFGTENKWAFFPSVAVGWRLSQEDFIQNIGVFSNMKLRASYGRTGNSEIGLYNSMAMLGVMSYTFGETFKSPGVGPSRMANPDLKWETTDQMDLGFEVGFMNNRLNFLVDAYYKKTTDLLLAINLQGTSGFVDPGFGAETHLRNIGSLENKGLEVTGNYDIFVGTFKWRLSSNIYFNRNEVLTLTEGGAIILSVGGIDKHGGKVYLDVGLPVGVWRERVFDGIFNDQAEVDAYVNSSGNPIQAGAVPGDVKMVDVNGDGTVDGNDQDIIGDPNPDYTFGITNDFSFKGFDLSIFIKGSQGNDINAPTFVHAKEMSTMSNGNLIAEMWNRWTPTNTNTDIPRAGATYGYPNYEVFDGSYIRIKNVRLTYHIPAQNIPWLKNAQVYVNLENLVIFTDYPGFDPEVNSAGQSAWQRGIALNPYPAMKTVILGIKIGL